MGKKIKRIVIDESWFEAANGVDDDATLLAVFKYALRGELPDDVSVLERVEPALHRVDADRSKREAQRLRRAERARAVKEARAAITPEVATVSADVQSEHNADYAQIFHSFPSDVRRDLAVREVAAIEAEVYPAFERFVATYNPSYKYLPDANWTRFRQLFPLSWPAMAVELDSILAASDIRQRNVPLIDFFRSLALQAYQETDARR